MLLCCYFQPLIELSAHTGIGFVLPQSPAVPRGDRHHSENSESFVHNCLFWIIGQAKCTCNAYIQQRARCNSTALINPWKFTLATEYVSLLLCWSSFKESWDAPHMVTLPESSLETAVPPWPIPLVPLGSGTLSCVNVLFQSANRSC